MHLRLNISIGWSSTFLATVCLLEMCWHSIKGRPLGPRQKARRLVSVRKTCVLCPCVFLPIDVFPSFPYVSGRHRFAAILFKQPEQIDVSDYKTITAAQVEPRKKFSTREFVVAHSLGLPVAVNFFEARHDKVTTEPAAAAHLGRNERSKIDSTEKAAKQKADDHSRPAAAAKKPGTKKATKKSKKKPPPGAPTVDASRTRADNSRADRPPVVETQQAQAKAPSDTKVEEIKEATVEASVGTDGDASMSTDAEAKNVLPVRMLQLLEDLDDELSPKESRLLRKMVRKGNKEVELAFLAAEKAASPKDQRRRFLRDAREILDEF